MDHLLSGHSADHFNTGNPPVGGLVEGCAESEVVQGIELIAHS